MILSDADIVHFRNLEHLDITPYNALQLQPASYDLTLAPQVNTLFAPGVWRTKDFDAYHLMPDEFALFSTVETIRLDGRVAAQVMGKSTWARKGLIIESAGWVDPGFEGQLTLELKNLTNQPILLLAGDPIAQIVFMELRSNALVSYEKRGRYQGQRGPTPPRQAR